MITHPKSALQTPARLTSRAEFEMATFGLATSVPQDEANRRRFAGPGGSLVSELDD